jgi:type 1 fimbriae regulatory protein FimB
MPQRKYLTESEVEMLLDAAQAGKHGERNHCLVYMGFLHGFRVSELLGLHLSDVDLSGRTLNVRRLKNGFSTVHPLLTDEVKVLRAWLNARKGYRYADEQSTLFLTQLGTAMTRQQFYNILRRLGEAAAIPVTPHPHMLRHACGYALANNGVDTRLIQDYLGHRNIQHTVRYTASNAGRFEGVWRPRKRRRGRHLEPKCKTPAIQCGYSRGYPYLLQGGAKKPF